MNDKRVLTRIFRCLTVVHALLAPCFVIAGVLLSVLSEGAPGMGELMGYVIYMVYAAVSALLSFLAALYLHSVARRSAPSRGQRLRGIVVASASSWWALKAAISFWDALT